MRSRILRWIVPPLILVLLVTVFTLRPSREEQTIARFEADRATLEELAKQVLSEGSDVKKTLPEPWRAVQLHDGGCPSVELLFGALGMGSETSYWGVNYVPCGHTLYMLDFYDMGWELLEKEDNIRVFYEPEGDNTCYVKQLDTCWYYYEMSF